MSDCEALKRDAYVCVCAMCLRTSFEKVAFYTLSLADFSNNAPTMESLLSSPSVTIRNSAEAMAELHECLVGMARREAVLRTQLEEASAERAIALSRAAQREAAAGTAVTEKAAAAGGLGTGAAQLRAPLGAEQGGLAQAQQGVSHQQRELQSDVQSAVQSAREERERHEAEVAALHAQHRAQVDAMRAELAQAHQTADAALEQALAL